MATQNLVDGAPFPKLKPHCLPSEWPRSSFSQFSPLPIAWSSPFEEMICNAPPLSFGVDIVGSFFQNRSTALLLFLSLFLAAPTEDPTDNSPFLLILSTDRFCSFYNPGMGDRPFLIFFFPPAPRSNHVGFIFFPFSVHIWHLPPPGRKL